MTLRQPLGLFSFCAILLILPHTVRPLGAVTVRVDYSQDASNFFSPSTTQGQQARAVVNAAAAYYSDLLEDSLTPVNIPERYDSPSNAGWAEYYLDFANPSNPFDQQDYVQLSQYDVGQDEFVIFAGGAAIGGTQIASAGMGGVWAEWELWTPAEYEEVLQTLDQFEQDVSTRGQSSGFANWGGTISFDSDGSTNWNRSLAAPSVEGQSDLYSVALHEMAHVLGFRRATMEELGLINSADKFIGHAAVDSYGSPVPLQAGGGHWAEGTMSTVYDGATTQETLFDPSFNGTVRKLLTRLDAAALSDLGWNVASSTALPGDFNGDGRVDAIDYAVWRKGLYAPYTMADYQLWRSHFGASSVNSMPLAAAPEPAGTVLSLIALGLLCRRRR